MKEKLIAEIDDDKINYAVFCIDEKNQYKILAEKTSNNLGIKKGKIFSLEVASQIVSKDLRDIEKKLDKVFTNISVVINGDDFLCTNLTGFKKLNGSKVEKRDLEYILNEAKSSIIKNQEKNSILHILNSNFFLDKKKYDQIPLDVFGNHLSLHMTFISLPKNNLKNINMLFDNCDLKIERIINKPFACGINFINHKKNLRDFILINFDKEFTSISVYKNSALIFLKTLSFGTNMIYRDVVKLCSLELNEVQTIVNELDFNNFLDTGTKDLEKNFFNKSNFNKVSIQHFKNIVEARVEEMVKIIFNKNSTFFEDKYPETFLLFEDEKIRKKLGFYFQKSLKDENFHNTLDIYSHDNFTALKGAAELIYKGWHKEAIPFIHKKKSIISSFFSRFF